MADARTSKHLQFVQKVIARLAGHSFTLKGWSITLTAALLGVAAKEGGYVFALVALVPATVFWSLDAYYLRLERQYRSLYDDVRTGRCEPFAMSASGYSKQAGSLPRTMLAAAVIGVHGVIVAMIGLAFWFLAGRGGKVASPDSWSGVGP